VAGQNLMKFRMYVMPLVITPNSYFMSPYTL